MKYYQYLLISILFSFFQSCREKDNILKYDLETLRATIKLPNTYSPVNKERLDRILDKKEDEGFKDELLDMIQRKKNVKMLIDTVENILRRFLKIRGKKSINQLILILY